MNKIININLAGRLIPIEEEAYTLLKEYIDQLKVLFGKEEGGAEIIHDMEDRIGELLQSKIKRGAVAITHADIEEVKSIMGQPDDIAGESADSEEQAQSENTNQQNHQSEPTPPKHLFRSRNEKLVGGVCGGMASYFNVDPVIIRAIFILVTLFWGSGLLVYLVLWILLKEEDSPKLGLKKRWYRNEDKKILGGVCAGIASYLNTDPIWPRLVFIVPILLGMGFGVSRFWTFHFLSIGVLPSTILLYLILWIIMPKASTLTEKLEMEGKKIDVHNLSEAVKNEEIPAKSKSRGCLVEAFVILFKATLIIIGGFILLILLTVVVALGLSMLGIGVGLFSSVLSPLSDSLFTNNVEKIFLFVSLVLVVLIPLYLLVRFLVQLISHKKSNLGRTWTTTLVILFLVGAIGLFFISAKALNEFSAEASSTKNLSILPVNNDTLIISGLPAEDGWENDDDFSAFEKMGRSLNLKVHLTGSDSFAVKLQKSSRGSSQTKAKKLRDQIQIPYQQKDNRLKFPAFFDLPPHSLFRNQKATLIIQVPEGKYVRFEQPLATWWLRQVDFRSPMGVTVYNDKAELPNYQSGVYQMKADGTLEKVD